MSDFGCCEMDCCQCIVFLAQALDACCCQESCCEDDGSKAACCECRSAILNAIKVCAGCCDTCCKTPASTGLVKGVHKSKLNK